RHRNVVVFLEQRRGDRIALGSHPIRLGQITGKPRAVPSGRHAGKIWPDLVTLADGVAGTASTLKEKLPFVGHTTQGNLRIALRRPTARPTKENTDRRGEKPGIVDGGVAHPLAGGLVADHEARAVPVSSQRVAAARQPQLLGDESDVALLAGEKQPAGPDAELLGIGLEHGGRISFGIDADRVEEDVLAHPVAEKLLHLGQPRRLERALVLTAGVDEVYRPPLAPEQIVTEGDARPGP